MLRHRAGRGVIDRTRRSSAPSTASLLRAMRAAALLAEVAEAACRALPACGDAAQAVELAEPAEKACRSLPASRCVVSLRRAVVSGTLFGSPWDSFAVTDVMLSVLGSACLGGCWHSAARCYASLGKWWLSASRCLVSLHRVVVSCTYISSPGDSSKGVLGSHLHVLCLALGMLVVSLSQFSRTAQSSRQLHAVRLTLRALQSSTRCSASLMAPRALGGYGIQLHAVMPHSGVVSSH